MSKKYKQIFAKNINFKLFTKYICKVNLL